MFTEDLSAFFDTDEHAVSVVYTAAGFSHPGPSSVTVSAIFDADTIEVSGGGVEVRGYRSMLYGAASDFPGITEGAKVTVESQIYSVASDPEYDETNNLIMIQLRKVH